MDWGIVTGIVGMTIGLGSFYLTMTRDHRGEKRAQKSELVEELGDLAELRKEVAEDMKRERDECNIKLDAMGKRVDKLERMTDRHDKIINGGPKKEERLGKGHH